MSKGQQKTTFNDASGLLNSFEGANAADVTALQGETANAANTAASQLGTAQNAYAGLGPAGIANILQPATSAASGIAATGGYAQPQLNTLEGQEQTNLQGLDPAAAGQLASGYQDLISTGGISDATAAAMQRQATSGVSSLYGTLSNQLNRSKAVTGGQGGGGETAQLARQLSSAEANAVTGVNAQVGQLRQQGTEAGLAGGSNLASAQAAAQDAAARTYGSTQSGVASGLQTGAGQLGSLGATQLSGNLASAGGEAGLAQLTAQQQLALAGLTQQQQLGGAAAEQGFEGVQSKIAVQPGWYGSLVQGVNAAGNLAGGVGNLLRGIGGGGTGGGG